MDQTSISIWACSSSPDFILTIKLNNETKFSGTLTDNVEEITFLFEDNKPRNVLEISMTGKLPTHTIINSNNEIVKDQLIKIQDLSLDGIKLGYLFFEKSVYIHDFNGTQLNSSNNKFFGHMGCNGTVRFEFSGPVFMWLLENM
jgi:hypothetical protein